jgi:hypothetical protein
MLGAIERDGEHGFAASVGNFDFAIGCFFAGTFREDHQVAIGAERLVPRIIEIGEVHADPIPGYLSSFAEVEKIPVHFAALR